MNAHQYHTVVVVMNTRNITSKHNIFELIWNLIPYSSDTQFLLNTLRCILQTGVELELMDSMPLLEWLANNYKSFGATLEIITDRSQEGSQYVRGFGGIGGTYSGRTLVKGRDMLCGRSIYQLADIPGG